MTCETVKAKITPICQKLGAFNPQFFGQPLQQLCGHPNKQRYGCCPSVRPSVWLCTLLLSIICVTPQCNSLCKPSEWSIA